MPSTSSISKVEEGEIFGLIGPNGSGKSTTVNLICGVLPVTGGRVVFEDRDITGAAPHRVLAAGVARTFQNIRLFDHLTVWQNLWVAQNSIEDRRRENYAKRWFFGSGGGARCGGRAARLRRADRQAGRARRQPLLRRAAPPRAGPGPCHQAQASAARRTGRRHEPGGGARAGRPPARPCSRRA